MTHTLPRSVVADPHTAPPPCWGVLGPGWIAERFVATLQHHTGQRVVAVGSRDVSRADAFAERMGVPRAHGSYDELVADDGVDVVYVATPHRAHHPVAAAAMRAGKHVLVEKPLAISARQVADLATLSRQHGVFCAEALWSSFLPKYDVLRQVVASGVLGDVRVVLADHGEHFQPGHRILDADLAGGPLFDLGTYPIAFALYVLADVSEVMATGRPAPSGVNGELAIVLTDHRGAQAVLHTTILSNTPTTAVIAGTAATITLAVGRWPLAVVRRRTARRAAGWRDRGDRGRPRRRRAWPWR